MASFLLLWETVRHVTIATLICSDLAIQVTTNAFFHAHSIAVHFRAHWHPYLHPYCFLAQTLVENDFHQPYLSLLRLDLSPSSSPYPCTQSVCSKGEQVKKITRFYSMYRSHFGGPICCAGRFGRPYVPKVIRRRFSRRTCPLRPLMGNVGLTRACALPTSLLPSR